MKPVLRNLHWLPIRHRIKIKTAVLVYKCLHGMASPHLASYCTWSHHKLDDPTCDPPQQANSLCHVQGQPTAAVVWNSLPAELRSPDISLGRVRKTVEDFSV